ncbi:glycoside hydrolase family 3 C-terminal domain-containing protein [Actinomadura meyerae]|uniref:glycoside hydrolase family 3 C-terminal domain-containing protein n=1 Tax=Actinomadura meyerae TaxID=240840 RepID=UPI001FE8C30A|nr:glycoside hydrolase family 3 C-terminal domain-containing protein [Actinomadura meyerae]
MSGPGAARLQAALRRRGVTVVAAGAADVTVLTTQNAGAATASRIRALGPKPVVVAALGRPYDLDAAGGAKAALAAYSSGAVTVNALAGVLSGAVKPVGKLPVPAGGRPAGYGLGYP